ncbi:response regulator [Thermomonas carbonis]|uniref:Response regulator n=1 Tax=Thermomonas carbonis TaxID=1463158 RepID=A0A7G9SMV6_9GAMM|nr:response regulator [Thermomonas carbonis]QNN69181.1 response regulator [Thermomonas carbonis]GHC06224.1 transcriptional regulator [Thermomonas carbonis]
MNPATANALPRLLLVEDDPVSAAFLRDAASALPAEVQVAGSLAEAGRAIAQTYFDLWLVDANLPDGRGEILLDAGACGANTPALAHTATNDAAARERLLAAGFIEVLCKPLGVAALHAALRRHLPLPSHRVNDAALPDWNDAGALAALGEVSHVEALRQLFLRELPARRARIVAAAGDVAAMHAELHRLSASCGFVGADRLRDAVRLLMASPSDPAAMHAFVVAADALIAA